MQKTSLNIEWRFIKNLLKNIVKYSILPLPGILGIINPLGFGPLTNQVVINLSVSYLAASLALLGNHIKNEYESWKTRTGIDRIFSFSKYIEYIREESNKNSPFQDKYKELLDNLCLKEIYVNGKNEILCIDGFVDFIFNPTIDISNIKFKAVTEHTRHWHKILHDIIEPYYDIISNLFQLAPTWNELKPRLKNIENNKNEIIINVEPTSYFYTFITHYCPDFKLPGRYTEKTTLRKIIEPLLITNQGKLVDINEYRCLPISASLGINILLISCKDHYIMIPKRSKYVAIAPKLYGVSVAGSIDWKTIYPEGELSTVVIQEISEKLELSPEKLELFNRIIPLGIVRSAWLLGEPGIFTIGFTNTTREDILRFTELGIYKENIDYISVPLSPYKIHSCQDIKDINDENVCNDLSEIFNKILGFIKENYNDVGTSLHLLITVLAVVLYKYCKKYKNNKIIEEIVRKKYNLYKKKDFVNFK